MQAIGWSSARPGSSVAGSRWVATSRKPPLPAASSAASERARPIESGTDMPGKTTASRTGSTGSTAGTSIFSSPIVMVWGEPLGLLKSPPIAQR